MEGAQEQAVVTEGEGFLAKIPAMLLSSAVKRERLECILHEYSLPNLPDISVVLLNQFEIAIAVAALYPFARCLFLPGFAGCGK